MKTQGLSKVEEHTQISAQTAQIGFGPYIYLAPTGTVVLSPL